MTISYISAVLSGAIAMASLAATLFFLKFWRRTSDIFSCYLRWPLQSMPWTVRPSACQTALTSFIRRSIFCGF